MRLDISEAILLILSIPAHRSQNEGHRVLGNKAIDLVLEYKDLASNEDKAYNMAMIGAVLSAARLFSVERDRISEKWRSIEYIKERRLRILEVFQNISPFSKGNYWAKILVLLSAGGLSVGTILSEGYKNTPSFFVLLVFLLLIFEFISKLGEYLYSKWIEERVPLEKSKKWVSQSLDEYKSILNHFIGEAVDIHLRYYPHEKELYGYDLNSKCSINDLKEYLIQKHFHEFHD